MVGEHAGGFAKVIFILSLGTATHQQIQMQRATYQKIKLTKEGICAKGP